MRPGTPGFVGSRLREAREARDVTAVTLAELVGVTPQAISHYEHDRTSPSPETLRSLARVLNLSEHFFTLPERGLVEHTIFYRSMSSATKRARSRAEWKFQWLQDIVSYLSEFVAFPEPNFPVLGLPSDPLLLSDDEIELAAQEARRHWGMGAAPIGNVVTLLENQGAILARQKLGAESLDGLSAFVARDRRPYILLGTDKGTAVRWRFDAAHELGHVLLHSEVDQRVLQKPAEYKRIEAQAHRFAAAFLLPLEPFGDDFFAATLDVFRQMKKKWKVSIAMMLMRARQADFISEETYKRLWINYGRNRWRRQEPYDDELEPEEPRLLRRAVELILSSGSQSPEDFVGRFGLSPADIESLVGLPAGYLAGDFSPVRMLDQSRDPGPSPSPDQPPADVIQLPYRPR